MRILIAVLFTLAFSLLAQAQTNLNSLYSIWQDETQPNSSRSTAYEIYIWNGFLFSNPDTASLMAEDLLAFAKTHEYPKAAGLAYFVQGVSNAIKGDYVGALEFFEKSLKIKVELGDKVGIASTMNNIGNIYNNQGNYPRALEYYENSLLLYEELGDKNGISSNLSNIGGIYFNQGNYQRALENYEKSLNNHEKLGDKAGIASLLSNIGAIYQKQGDNIKATYLLLKDDPQFTFESRGMVEAKGKGEMEMFFLSLKNVG